MRSDEVWPTPQPAGIREALATSTERIEIDGQPVAEREVSRSPRTIPQPLIEAHRQVQRSLEKLYALPVLEAARYADSVDADAFALAPGMVGLRDAIWWQLADIAFDRYRAALHCPATRLELILERSFAPRDRGADFVDITEEVTSGGAGARCPRWMTGLRALDDASGGGLYGTSVVVGAPGSGKSLLVVRSALLAASAGWKVIYFDSELGRENLKARMECLSRGEPAAFLDATSREFVDATAIPRLSFLSLEAARDGLAGMAESIADLIGPHDERVLVVIDHVHDFARAILRSSSETNPNAFFRVVEDIAECAKQARRQSNGDIGFMLVAEQNQRGGIKGGTLDFAADCIVSLGKSADLDSTTEVRVVKGREGGEGDFGSFKREWQVGKLEPLGFGEAT